MPKKKTKNQTIKESPVPDQEYSSHLSPDTGSIKEAGYGKSTDLELASFENTEARKEVQDINVGLYSESLAALPGQNFKYGNLEDLNNLAQNYNNLNASVNKQDILQNEYAAEFAPSPTNDSKTKKDQAKLDKE